MGPRRRWAWPSPARSGLARNRTLSAMVRNGWRLELDRAGRASEAATALREAIALYQRKGNVVSGARAHTILERLEYDAAVTDASSS
jgi:hypothetical protein